MPVFRKKTLSNYLRTNCKRRLALDLWPDTRDFRAARETLGMPPRFIGRPGLTLLARQGEEWESAKVVDLENTLGQSALVGNRSVDRNGAVSYGEQPLLNALSVNPVAGALIVQGQYDVRAGSTFESALDISALRGAHQLQYARLRPDLIQILAPGSVTYEVAPNGTLNPVDPGDVRYPLRVVDIKLTAEPSNAYFAEVALYSITLVGWLADEGLDDRYFVAPTAAVWPGSHEASSIVKVSTEARSRGGATQRELLAALDADLIPVPFDVFAARLRRFFRSELPEVLSKKWNELPWHVDNRCSGCDYLGYDWGSSDGVDPKHCWPLAEANGHLSRVAFVTTGARMVLEENDVRTVADLSALDANSDKLREHQGLRASKIVVTSRARALDSGQAMSPQEAGTSALMPKWADLRLYVSADFDIGSGITSCFGFKSFYYSRDATPNTFPGQRHEFPVDTRDPLVERRELMRFLDQMKQEMDRAVAAKATSTIQVYVWDSVTFDHLVRVLGRHLPWLIGNDGYKKLIWLFPPEEVLKDPELSDRRSPVCIVRDVIRAIAAVPVPHYYSLLNVARVYHENGLDAGLAAFTVPNLFEDPLSDQVPSERIHEVWAREPNWSRSLENLKRTVGTKLRALESVTKRLSEELAGRLDQTAPRITDLGAPTLPQSFAPASRLWYLYSKLNAALQKLDIQQGRAMPVHEREARFRSAFLPRRMRTAEELTALTTLGLTASATTRVYELGADSVEVKAKDGDFSFCLSPASDTSFFGRKLATLLNSAGLDGAALGIQAKDLWLTMDRVTKATVRHIDRDRRIVVVELDATWQPVIAALEAAGQVNLTGPTCLDPTYHDFFTPRLQRTLAAIGNPPCAVPPPALGLALGARNRQRAGTSIESPAAEVLWSAATMATTVVTRDLAGSRGVLEAAGVQLNHSQWIAWEEALSKRLTLIWGPPGTGKSKTLRAILLGSAVSSNRSNDTLRVLITGPTYEAVDNVLAGSVEQLKGTNSGTSQPVTIRRLRSSYSPPCSYDPSIDCETKSQSWEELSDQLRTPTGVVVVAGTPQQVHRLLDHSGSPVAPRFDIVILDEASQVDVATSTLVLAGLAQGGSLIVAGDPKQLPPIHPAEPPKDFEDLVGPIFTYLEESHGVQPKILLENYRSNQEIVSIGYGAGYPRDLVSASPNMRLQVAGPLPSVAPVGWPGHLIWTPEWSSILAPDLPAVAFIYSDAKSCQSNGFEADSVASLVALAKCQMIDPKTSLPFTEQAFWQQGVGVVTPHRAQQALVVQRLQRAFPDAPPGLIRSSVDTVERFQGQERQVIIASYAIGDTDAIGAEESFLMSLNRFNVAVSRPKSKLIVFLTQELVDHLSSDSEALEQSGLLKHYAETFCSNGRQMTLPSSERGDVIGEFRWH